MKSSLYRAKGHPVALTDLQTRNLFANVHILYCIRAFHSLIITSRWDCWHVIQENCSKRCVYACCIHCTFMHFCASQSYQPKYAIFSRHRIPWLTPKNVIIWHVGTLCRIIQRYTYKSWITIGHAVCIPMHLSISRIYQWAALFVIHYTIYIPVWYSMADSRLGRGNLTFLLTVEKDINSIFFNFFFVLAGRTPLRNWLITGLY